MLLSLFYSVFLRVVKHCPARLAKQGVLSQPSKETSNKKPFSQHFKCLYSSALHLSMKWTYTIYKKASPEKRKTGLLNSLSPLRAFTILNPLIHQF
jgi:hypothetical protein